MDGEIQPDGSLLATRIAVYDSDTATLSTMSGPLVALSPSVSGLLTLNVEDQGPILNGSEGGPVQFGYGSAVFQISGQLTNLQSLPFTASFNGSNMVPGQKVFITTHAPVFLGGPKYTPTTTITLLPQTINGTVSAISSSGSFTTYTVTLAAYDIFPDFATQPGVASLLTNPNTVVVYVSSNTQQLTSEAIATGSIVRFNGLVFNDNGTLRMDCAQMSDGVTE
jgi:hypothetical protein